MPRFDGHLGQERITGSKKDEMGLNQKDLDLEGSLLLHQRTQLRLMGERQQRMSALMLFH